MAGKQTWKEGEDEYTFEPGTEGSLTKVRKKKPAGSFMSEQSKVQSKIIKPDEPKFAMKNVGGRMVFTR